MPRAKLKGRKKKMENAEPATPETPADQVLAEKVSAKNDVQLIISAPEDGALNVLHIYVRAPVLAEVIRKMATGNYPADQYAEIYKPLLIPLEADKKRVVTRPAICKATKNFRAATDFDMNELPCPALLSNPDKLAEGYTIVHKLDKPYAHETLRKWGKAFMDGCADIIHNARPFKMSWVMQEIK